VPAAAAAIKRRHPSSSKGAETAPPHTPRKGTKKAWEDAVESKVEDITGCPLDVTLEGCGSEDFTDSSFDDSTATQHDDSSAPRTVLSGSTPAECKVSTPGGDVVAVGDGGRRRKGPAGRQRLSRVSDYSHIKSRVDSGRPVRRVETDSEAGSVTMEVCN